MPKNVTPAQSISLAESGRREAVAQLEIMTALSKVGDESAERIIRAIGLILEADRLIPGIMDRLARKTGDEANA